MAVPTNTYRTFDTDGVREELSDIIALVANEDCPFQTMAETRTVRSDRHDWQKRNLRSSNLGNAHAQGDDTTMQAANVPDRVHNYTQISKESVIVSGTTTAVDHAGIQDVLDDQIEVKLAELKRDREAILLNNRASVAGADGVVGYLGPLTSWLETNAIRAGDGADGGFNPGTGVVDAATDGTQRAFTIDLLEDAFESAHQNGGKPNTLMVGTKNKRAFSAFDGIADLRRDVPNDGQARLTNAADFYIGNFGTLQVVPNIQQRERDAFLIDPRFVAIGELRAPFYEELAKNGDNTKGHIVCEYTLIVDSEAAHAVVADLTDT